MSDLTTLLADAKGCGVYHLMREPYEIERAAQAAGMVCHRMDIGHAHGTADVIAHVAKGFNFPAHFGKNMDALHDSLTDLEWLGDTVKGYVLVFEKSKHFGAGHKHEFDEAMEVLTMTSDYWRGKGKPFWAFVHGAQGWKSGLAEWGE
jgi:RNAse (barnase) inhibitor barstar